MENIYFSLVKMIAILAAMVFGMIFFYRHARKMNPGAVATLTPSQTVSVP